MLKDISLESNASTLDKPRATAIDTLHNNMTAKEPKRINPVIS